MNRDDIKVGDRLVVTEDHRGIVGGHVHPQGDVLTARGYAGGEDARWNAHPYGVCVTWIGDDEDTDGYADARYLAPDDGRVVGGLTDDELNAVDDDREATSDAALNDAMCSFDDSQKWTDRAGTDCPCIDAPGRIPLDAVRAAAALLGGPGRDLPVDAVLSLAVALDASERVAAEALPHTWDGDLELTADGDGPEALIDVRQRGGARLLVATNADIDLDDVREAAAAYRMLLDAMTERGAR